MRDVIYDWSKTLRIPGKPDEWELKNLLKMTGLNVPDGCRFLPGETADESKLEFPVVLKVCDPDILHKTEVGGVVLNVDAEGFHDQVCRLQALFPESPLLAESMCRIDGTEFILGGLADPVFGPAVMAGAGGVLTELYEDAVFRLCPCTKSEAVRMLGELKIAPVLKGYRGSRLDLDALADTVSTVSRLLAAFGDDMAQFDINPLVWTGERWTALDCVLVMKQAEPSLR